MRKHFIVKLDYNAESIEAVAGNIEVSNHDNVLVKTANGSVTGKITSEKEEDKSNDKNPKIARIVRRLTDEDFEKINKLENKNNEARKICREKIREHKLPMHIVKVHHFFEGNKIIFFFTSNNRVDFRTLVKDLASEFHSRIELRQIGNRDETKMIGGIGGCGRQLCCNLSGSMIKHVSVKMAKEQNMTLNSSKISGVCGRLLCCLEYEYETYKKLNKEMPKLRSRILYKNEEMEIIETNILKEEIKLRKKDGNIIKVQKDEIRIIPTQKKKQKNKTDKKVDPK